MIKPPCTKPGCDCMTRKAKPCQTPGCNYPVWHPCLVGKPDTFPDLVRAQAQRPRRKVSESTRIAGQLAMIQRWDRMREINKERDKKIVARYAEGDVSIRDLMLEFGLGHYAVSSVLHRAASEGKIQMRKPGGRTREVSGAFA